MKACRGRRDIAPLIYNLGTRWWWILNSTPGQLYPWERTSGLRASLDGFVEEKIS
jgi:hypothetical protein